MRRPGATEDLGRDLSRVDTALRLARRVAEGRRMTRRELELLERQAAAVRRQAERLEEALVSRRARYEYEADRLPL